MSDGNKHKKKLKQETGNFGKEESTSHVREGITTRVPFTELIIFEQRPG